MDDERLLRALAENTAFLEALGRTGGGARILRRDGVMAAIVPVCPERSVFNSVVYDDAEGLAGVYDELSDAYAEAGVAAWTVWVPEGDAAAAMLAERGHLLDAEPLAMGMELAGVERPVGEPVDWVRAPAYAVVGRLNDLAYGYEDGSFERALGALAEGTGHWYLARLDGEPACGLMTIDHGTDAEVNMVATLPGAQGRGLATALMRQALADARERGMETTTLVATKPGRPVYERIGYRALWTLQMWERRDAG